MGNFLVSYASRPLVLGTLYVIYANAIFLVPLSTRCHYDFYIVLFNGPSPASSPFIFVFSKNNTIFATIIRENMSIQHTMVLGFKPTTSRT